MRKYKYLSLLIASIFFISFVSADLGSLTTSQTIDTPKLSVSSLTLELKGSPDVIWKQEANSYTPEYKDTSKYITARDSKTGITTKSLIPIPTITFTVNKLHDDWECSEGFYQKECKQLTWDFSKFESKNTITNKEIIENHPTLLECIWRENIIYVNQIKDCMNELVNVDIKYTGTITDLDPILTWLYSTTNSARGFFNNTQATTSGINLTAGNLSGDFKSYVYYNASAMNWSVTLGTANTATNKNITLQFRTASSYNLSDPSLVGFWAMEQGNGTFFVDETGKNNGTCSGTTCPTYTNDGVVGGAMVFNESQYISTNVLNWNSSSYWINLLGAWKHIASDGNLTYVNGVVACPSGMAYVNKYGGYCIDKYEASMPSANTTYIGNASDFARINNPGTMKATSQPNVVPWVSVSANSARTACSNAGKYLCSSPEWLGAADIKGKYYNLPTDLASAPYYCNTNYACPAGSYNGTGNGMIGAGGSACRTGNKTNCVSSNGVYDMTGNVWEWTNETVSYTSPCGGVAGWCYYNGTGWQTTTNSATAKYGNDGVYFTAGAQTGKAVFRGGAWLYGADGGPFSGYVGNGPTYTNYFLGFRCCSRQVNLESNSIPLPETNYSSPTSSAVYSNETMTFNADGVYTNISNTIIGNVNGTIDDVLLFNRNLGAGEVLDLYNLGSVQFSDWSTYGDAQPVISGTPLTSPSNKFMQFKANFNTNSDSPRITYHSITNTLSECGDLTAPNTIYTLASNVTSTGTCFTISANNITLDGAGYTINYSANGTLGYGVYNPGYNFTTVKNARIVEGSAIGNFKHNINFASVNNGTIYNNSLTLAYGYSKSISLSSSNGNSINNNIFLSAPSYGNQRMYWGKIMLDLSKNNQINNNVFVGGSAFDLAISLSSSNNNQLNNNSFNTSSSYGSGIYVITSNNSVISNNTITLTGTAGSYGAIYLQDSSNNTLTGNKANSSSMQSYLIYGTTSAHYNQSIDTTNLAEGLPVVYNYSINNQELYPNQDLSGIYGQVICAFCNNVTYNNVTMGGDGINLFYTSNSSILNSNINTAVGNGVYLYKNSIGNNISNNNINTSSGYGIDLDTSCNNNLIGGNNLRTTTGGGVYTISSSNSNTISSNNIITTSGNGFYSNSNSNTVIYNNITTTSGSQAGGTGWGIYLTSSSSNNISSNILTVGTSLAIGLHASSSSNIINSNNITITSASGWGIWLYSNSNNQVISNTITGNPAYGIYLWLTSADKLSSNSITTISGKGIFLNTVTNNNTFSNMSVITNSSAAFYISSGDNNFTITDSILNSSLGNDVYIGGDVTGGSWNFTNVTRSNGNPINISWVAGANGTLNMKWYADIVANTSTGINISGANINAWDVNGLLVNTTSTDSEGKARTTVLEYTRINNTIINYFSNYTFNATKATWEDRSVSMNMSNNKLIWFLMTQDATPPVLTLLSPLNTTYFYGSVSLNGSCSDNRAVNRTTYSYDNGIETTFNFNTTFLGGQYEDWHTILVRCYDNTGNQDSTLRRFYLGGAVIANQTCPASNTTGIWSQTGSYPNGTIICSFAIASATPSTTNKNIYGYDSRNNNGYGYDSYRDGVL
jgi:parallel beta-helix repeat protein